jgi:uncharacterized protein YecE (DUF72 family)
MIPTEVVIGVADSADSETALPYLEIQETFIEPPEPKGAEQWRKPGRQLGLVAWQVITHPRSSPSYKEMETVIPEHAAVGHFARSRWTDEAWERTDAVARSMRAAAVVLRTPASFRPGGQNELHMENFIAHAMRPALSLAWEWTPGSWNEPRALALAERIGVIPVVDPLDRPVPPGETIYLRVVGGKSGRRSPSDDQLKKLAEQLRDRAGWVVFGNKSAEQDAQRLAQMI